MERKVETLEKENEKEKKKKKKMVFELGPKTTEQLNYLKQELGTTEVSIVRKALTFYNEAFKEVHEKSGEILLVDEKGGVRKLLIL